MIIACIIHSVIQTKKKKRKKKEIENKGTQHSNRMNSSENLNVELNLNTHLAF